MNSFNNHYLDNFLEHYERLNPEQRQAVEAIDGPVLVVAGPGSGKTQLLSLRVANILRQTDTPPGSILCLTFTDSAALNMRQRLRSIIGSAANQVAIHTFHSFGTEVINHNGEFFFFGAGYQPADELGSIALLERILQNLPARDPLKSYHPDHGWTYLKDIRARITDLKKAGLNPENFAKIMQINNRFLGQASELITDCLVNHKGKELVAKWPQLIQSIQLLDCPPVEYSPKDSLLNQLSQVQAIIDSDPKAGTKPITAWKNQNCKSDADKRPILKDYLNQSKYLSLSQVYQEYQRLLHAQGLFDFDDMLLEVVQAFGKYPELKYAYQEQFLYILVDEFQDTSGVQTQLLDNLINLEVTSDRPNIMVVGDDDQAIYKFQGASLENILQFRQKFPDTQTITLTKNYRSKQIILDLASQIIQNCQTRLSGNNGIDKILVSQVD